MKKRIIQLSDAALEHKKCMKENDKLKERIKQLVEAYWNTRRAWKKNVS